ncbi:MAG: GntR family transcriptional regulator [Desulfobacterales bacterium]|nr:GntR family transcriptional regulator [Desulfobacterales bacterium]
MLYVKSLREQVYKYLRDRIHVGKLGPGSPINISDLSQKLGISKTPLRDALIQLETEGFVKIIPRRGVEVNTLSLDDIRNAYQIVGALEGSVLYEIFDEIKPHHIKKMKRLNADMVDAIANDEFGELYEMNITFHDIFVKMTGNKALQQICLPIKQRLYEFHNRCFVKEWELINCDHHDQIIEMIEKGHKNKAAALMRDVHWGYDVNEKFIKIFYSHE